MALKLLTEERLSKLIIDCFVFYFYSVNNFVIKIKQFLNVSLLNKLNKYSYFKTTTKFYIIKYK